jgi:hypothetical protein
MGPALARALAEKIVEKVGALVEHLSVAFFLGQVFRGIRQRRLPFGPGGLEFFIRQPFCL